jgi:multiple sugar transport system ATP-binding protein
MTLGDRVAVMRAGILQQVDSPKNLYERPENLFVAGFIGSPSMNFLPGKLDGDKIELPFGTAQVPDRLKAALKSGGGGARDVIVGVRPEHFEDAAIEPDRPGLMKFKAKVDVVESMGSELYAYFDVETEGEVQSDELADLAKDAGLEDLPTGGGQHVVARLDSDSKATAGGEIELVLDTAELKLFDPDGGKSLTYSAGTGNGAGAKAASSAA